MTYTEQEEGRPIAFLPGNPTFPWRDRGVGSDGTVTGPGSAIPPRGCAGRDGTASAEFVRGLV